MNRGAACKMSKSNIDRQIENFIIKNWFFILIFVCVAVLYFFGNDILSFMNFPSIEFISMRLITMLLFIFLGVLIFRAIVLSLFNRKRFRYMRILPHDDDFYKRDDIYSLMQRFHFSKRKWFTRIFLGREWFSFLMYRKEDGEFQMYIGADKNSLLYLQSELKTIYPRVEFYEADDLEFPKRNRSVVGGRMKIKNNSTKKALPLARFEKDDLPALMLQMPATSWVQVNFSANYGRKIKKSIVALEKDIKKKKRTYDERSAFDKEELQGLYQRYLRNEIAFDCTVSLATASNDGVRHLKNIANVIQSNLHDVNELTYRRYRHSISYYPKHYVYRMLWTGTELANLVHLPYFDNRESVKVLKEHFPVNEKGAELLPPEVFADDTAIEFGELTHPIVEDRKVYVKKKMLSDHFAVAGKTGSGKSSLLNSILYGFVEDFIEQDRAEGFTFVDPAKDTAVILLNRLLKAESEGKNIDWNKVHWISFANTDYPVAMNLLYKREGEHEGLIADSITELIESNFEDRAAVAERLLRFCIRTLLADEEPHTILEVKKVLDDEQFRRNLLDKLRRDPSNYEIVDYWETDGPGNMKTSAMAVKNRIDIFSSSPVLKRCFGQFEMSLDVRKYMEEGHIVFFDVSNLNAIEISMISGYISYMYYRIAETRSTYPLLHLLCFDETARVGYVSTLEKIVAESRKFGLALGVSTQRLGQLSDGLRDSLVNVQDNYFILQQGAEDAPLALKFLNQEEQTYKVDFLTGLKPRHAFLMAKDEVDGIAKKYSCLVEVDPLDKYKPDLSVARHGTHDTDIADRWTLKKANELTTRIGVDAEQVDYEIMKYMNPNFDYSEYEENRKKQNKLEQEEVAKSPVTSVVYGNHDSSYENDQEDDHSQEYEENFMKLDPIEEENYLDEDVGDYFMQLDPIEYLNDGEKDLKNEPKEKMQDEKTEDKEDKNKAPSLMSFATRDIEGDK